MKRTPLARGTSVLRRTVLARGSKRIRQASTKRRAKEAAYSPLRSVVLERDGHACCLCSAATDLDVHHRKLKSRGGRDEHENLISLCRFHHGVVHQFPAWATAVGLMVPASMDPMDWPVLLDATRVTWPARSMLWQVPDGHGSWYVRAPHPDQHQEPAPWMETR